MPPALDIYADIRARLVEMRRTSTLAALKSRLGVSVAHLADLSNGKRPTEGITLGLLFRLSPLRKSPSTGARRPPLPRPR